MKALFKIASIAMQLLVSLLAILFVAPIVGHFANVSPADAILINIAAFVVIHSFVIVMAKVSPSMRLKVLNHQGILAGYVVNLYNSNLIDNLWADNKCLEYAEDESRFVTGGAAVYRPYKGSRTGYKTNRSVFPAQIIHTADSSVLYELDTITTNPEVIPQIDKDELNYDKRSETLKDHLNAQKDAVCKNWLARIASSSGADASTAKLLRTTGGSIAAHMPSATGNRKKALVADLRAAKKYFTKNNIKGRYVALMDADMYEQLTSDSTITNTLGRENQLADYKEDRVERLAGFDILIRSEVLPYDSSGVLKPFDEEGNYTQATGDNACILCWVDTEVTKATGEVKVFANNDDATMFGDVVSTYSRVGGRNKRRDANGVALGVVAIVQDAA